MGGDAGGLQGLYKLMYYYQLHRVDPPMGQSFKFIIILIIGM